MEFLSQYGLFLLETLTLVVAVLIVAAGILALAGRGKQKDKGKIEIKKINEDLESLTEQLQQAVLSRENYKRLQKDKKKQRKTEKAENKPRKNIFVLRFQGDIKAAAVQGLREQVTALLTIAKPEDEVLVTVESGGGVVHGYGLAASQLERIKQRNIALTVAVDKVAASGGYLMACVADKIIAAPFAIIGSIGVIAQIPNFNRLLKKNNIEFEQITAGEFKRTLTLFGENTDKARLKMQQDIEDIHTLFKDFVAAKRPQLDIETVATGEHWLAKRALELRLVDQLETSDDYLLKAAPKANIYEIRYRQKKSLAEKIAQSASLALEKLGFQTNQGFEENLWLK